MMSNELPEIRDSSGALVNRYLVLIMKKSWLGKEDTSLFSRLCTELPGILLWALKGLARLQQRGRLIQPTSSTEAIEDLAAMTSPVRAFLSECCEIKPYATIEIAVLFRAWCAWCSATGYSQPGNIQSFGKNFRAVLPEIGTIRPQEGLSRDRHYMGIALISPTSMSTDVRGQGEKEFN